MLLFYQRITTYRKTSNGYALNSILATNEILEVTFLITLIYKNTPEFLRYMQSMDKETKVWDLCPLKRHMVVAKIFQVNSNDVSLETEHFLTYYRTYFTSYVTV